MSSTNSFRASSSSTTPSMAAPKRYDVFLSFRGKDTRYTFTDHLYQALVKNGIRTFRDDNKLRRGEAIAPELLNAIEESRSSVIIFSENYAHSRWCLDELVKIMDCQKDHVARHTVFPIFYHVDPSHVRSQTGRFGEAFVDYQENWKDKVGRWRTALTEAGNLSGWHLLDGRYESNYIKEIIDRISYKLNCWRFDIDANLVGIDSRLKELHLRLHMASNDVRIIGVYGLGGIGKTTIAKAIYNRLSCEFEYMSFLENISEVIKTKGISHLQSQLLSDILREERNQDIKSDGHGASMVKNILLSKRVFIVLDDVDDQDQMEYLIGIREWLGKGSIVIITTRDKRLLTLQEVDDSYEVPGLNGGEAFTLFSLHAFKQNCPKLDFINLSWRAISYCKGLPLALKVLGSLLFNKTIPEWESELHKLEREPEAKIHKVLKRSYAGLDRTEKNILLDVACFLKGENIDSVTWILDGCDFYAARGIKNLYDKCLITLPNNQISMHDLIQQMSWEIVRENFPNKPNKWSRLWDPHDIERALRACEGIDEVETISLDLSKFTRVRFNPNALAKMTRLRLLKVHSGLFSYSVFDDISQAEIGYIDISHADIDYDVIVEIASKMKLGMDFEFPSYELRYLRWDGYPLEVLPFDGENLIELHLKCSNIKQLWQENKYLERLKVINMSHSKKLIQMPEFSSMPNLEELLLRGCVSLIDIHPSIGVLKKLRYLILSSCDNLKCLPTSIINLEALVELDLSKCSSFEKFPEIQGNMRSLRNLRLRQTAIRELPNGCDLESVEFLDLRDCLKFQKFPENGANMKRLNQLFLDNTVVKELPTGIAHWESLPFLDLSNCPEFEKFPENVGNMKSLKELCLNDAAIKNLPDSIGDLEFLEILDLSNCYKFEKLPEKVGSMKSLRELRLSNTAIKDLPDSIGDLKYLKILDLSSCCRLEKVTEKVGNMKSLEWFHLNNTAIKDLPDRVGDLDSVCTLDLSNCSKFEKVPEKVGNMRRSLRELLLSNTAIKDLPDSIGDLTYLEILDLSNCSNFEKVPEKVGNMKSLRRLLLRNTAVKDLPESILDLKWLMVLDLSNCSKFEKFPEIKRPLSFSLELCLGGTAIKELPSSIHNLFHLRNLNIAECKNLRSVLKTISRLKYLKTLCLDGCSGSVLHLGKLNINRNKVAGQIPELPSSLNAIHAHNCRSNEEVWSLLWYCHLNWLRSTATQQNWRRNVVFSVVIPEITGGIYPEWIRYYDNLRSEEVTVELPMNWYEDPKFRGFVISCVYRPFPGISVYGQFIIHGNGFEFKDSWSCDCFDVPHGNLDDQLVVRWYPKMAIAQGHLDNIFTLSIDLYVSSTSMQRLNINKSGVSLIFMEDENQLQTP